MIFSIANGGKFVVVGIVFMVLFFVLICFAAYMSLFRLWLQAFMSNAQVSLFDIIGMSFRKIKASVIVKCRIMSVQAGYPLSVNELQVAYLTGADVELITQAYIDARRSGKDFSFEEIVDAQRSQTLAKLLNK